MKHTVKIKRILSASLLTLIFTLSSCSGIGAAPEASLADKTGTVELTAAAPDTMIELATAAVQAETIEQETVIYPVEVNTEIVLATLNIKHGAEGLDKVAEAIRDVSADIIGLEEVDVNCERSGNRDEPAELARMAGYEYHAFSRAISLGGGEYGTALLSRYPIESFEVIKLDSGNREGRSAGHAVINVQGLRLDVIVTHLSYEDRSVRTAQMKTLGDMLAGFDRYVLLGDLNCFDINEITNLGAAYYVNRADRRYSTFRRYSSFTPDNIVVSDGFTELSSGVSEAECSDHKLLYATFTLTGQYYRTE